MIMDIINGIVMMILPITVVTMMVLYFSEIYNKRWGNIYKRLKALICFILTFGIIYSIFAKMIFDIYYVATVMNELEPLSYEAREIIFICITFIWNIIGSLLIIGIWKLGYYTNYNLINKLKEDLKKIKERKHYGRYENTN